jgi:hypothetical protein
MKRTFLRLNLLAIPAAAAFFAAAPSAFAQATPQLQAGGLVPPAPLPAQAAESPHTSTSEQLDSSTQKDAGRGLTWVYIEAEGGYSHVGLRTFNISEQNFSAGFIETQSNGGFVSAGVGARLVFITIGARGRIGFYDAWDIFSVGGELGFKIPLGNLEPHFELGGGYAALGSFKESVVTGALESALGQISINGFYARASAGLDYYVTPLFSLGARAGFDVLGLTRPGLDPAKITEIKSNPTLSDLQRKQADLLQLEGTSYGATASLSAVVGLHF